MTAATSDWFRSWTAGAMGNGNGNGNGAAAPAAAAAPPDGHGTAGTDGWAVGKHAAQIIAEPVRGDVTSAGLPTRVPQANLIPVPRAVAARQAAAEPAARDPGPKDRHRSHRDRRDHLTWPATA